MQRNYRNISAGSTYLGVTDNILLLDTLSGTINLYLPTANVFATYLNKSGANISQIQYRFSDIGNFAATNNITIVALNGATINGVSTLVLNTNGVTGTLVLVDNNWIVTINAISQGGGLPYSVYSALITQTGTDAPVATILQNTLSGTPVWSRNNVGEYACTLSGIFTNNKTIVFIGHESGELYPLFFVLKSLNAITIYTQNTQVGLSGGLDDVLNNTSIEIRVYS